MNGIACWYGGSIEVGDDDLANQSVIKYNTEDGILIWEAGNVRAERSYINGNSLNGVTVSGVGTIYIKDGGLTNNGEYALFVGGNAQANVANCVINTTNTGIAGVHVKAIYAGFIFMEDLSSSITISPPWGTVGNGNAHIGQ